MYTKRTLVNHGSIEHDCNPFVERVSVARPVSYYVRGGVDLDGVSTRKPLPAAFDTSDAIAAGEVDVFTDATVSKLDLLDMASTMAAESEARALKDGAREPNSD